MLARVVNVLAARLTKAPLLPLDPVQYAVDARTHLEAISKRAAELQVPLHVQRLLVAIDEYEKRAREVMQQVETKVGEGSLADDGLAAVNAKLLLLEREWLRPAEFNDSTARPWFRNLFAASDATSGYAAWMLPGLREHVEAESQEKAADAVRMYVEVFARLQQRMDEIDSETSSSE
jgi:N-acetylated-alpha-linked acidic dipeptidase